VIAKLTYTASSLQNFKGAMISVKGSVTYLKLFDTSVEKLPYSYYHAYTMEKNHLTARSDCFLIVGGGGDRYLDYLESAEVINTVEDSIIPRRSPAILRVMLIITIYLKRRETC